MLAMSALLSQRRTSSEQRSFLLNLPLDILLLILPYLDARSFLSFCSTCRAFQHPSIKLSASYWSYVTQSSFRVPNLPVLRSDGKKWQNLYRRLIRESHVFTWGNDKSGCLGHLRTEVDTHHVAWNVSFPTQIAKANHERLGTIVDVQCGGWSTVFLNSTGELFAIGSIEEGFSQTGVSRADRSTPVLLQYPQGYFTGGQIYDPATTIREFSSGRSHILGLSDSGRIWSWKKTSLPAFHIRFLRHDISERSASSDHIGCVNRVVAGWNKSSALISGIGILIWDVPAAQDAMEQGCESMLVLDYCVIPFTNIMSGRGEHRERHLGSIVEYVVLENFVVFVTSHGEVFATKSPWEDDISTTLEIVELANLRNPMGTAAKIQGGFRIFGLIQGGEVITVSQDYLNACWSGHYDNPVNEDDSNPPGLNRIPALQDSGVVSLAFGDWHFHALHASGHITSYGTEPHGCGALGLGGDGIPEGRLRGIRYVGFSHDGKLVPHAHTNGRQVWFQKEKRDWITFMTSGGCDPGEAMIRLRMAVTDQGCQGEVSEWLEQEGRDWDRWEALYGEGDSEEKGDGLGAHFVLRIAAGGWHSAAMVLVNQDLVERVRQRCIIKDETEESEIEHDRRPKLGLTQTLTGWASGWARWFLGIEQASEPERRFGPSRFIDPTQHGASPGRGLKYKWADDSFPRLVLSNGTEMPGTVPFNEWKIGRPEWKFEANQE